MLILKDLLERYQQIGVAPLHEIIGDYYLYDEKDYVEQLKSFAHLSPTDEQTIEQLAQTLISVAQESKHVPLINQLLAEYQLNQKEGVQLLALAEGLLRIKSPDTAYRFIQDKVVSGDWVSHKDKSDHTTVNMATEGLVLLKNWLSSSQENSQEKTPFNYWLTAGKNFLAQEALKLLINKLAGIFIKGSTIESALAKPQDHIQHCCSFDMLGEAALTEDDAERYLSNYLTAIKAIAKHQEKQTQKSSTIPDYKQHSISIKLSALTPKFSYRHQNPELEAEFTARIEKLLRAAHQHSVSVTLDAEEADQLELTLSVFNHLFHLSGLKGWGQLGIAVQAYGFRAIPTILYLSQLAKEHDTYIPIRLVKGAYWDTEIHKAQEMGLTGYPVFTQKSATDLNYQACCQLLLKQQRDGKIKPQFATHNAVTMASVITLAEELDPDHQSLFPIEFQRLHGMGETIYNALSGYKKPSIDYYVRSYCPVGPYQELLPYLIRRILENGANQSFLNALNSTSKNQRKGDAEEHASFSSLQQHVTADQNQSDLSTHPTSSDRDLNSPGDTQATPFSDTGLESSGNHSGASASDAELSIQYDQEEVFHKLPINGIIHYDRFRPEFPLPFDIYLPWLEGSVGVNVNHPNHMTLLADKVAPFFEKLYQVNAEIPENIHRKEEAESLFSPNQQDYRLGLSHTLTHIDEQALHESLKQPSRWKDFEPEQRIHVIKQFANSLRNNTFELIALCIQEAGKTWQDAIAEIREAIDFCNYYANQYQTICNPIKLPHTANERNLLCYKPKGNFLCISPWNFPIAILVGQVVAALLPGNRAIIKPAPQTQICGHRVYELLINCGVPKDSLYFMPATNQLSHQLVGNQGIDGIAFTGSLNTARSIQNELFNQRSYPVPLIAETSGLNCMITDDSILTEQMVKDVVASAFGSAGQRCSALRVLFLHESIYQESITAIKGVMSHLVVGPPQNTNTDIGPIIDVNALERLAVYVNERKADNQLLLQQEVTNTQGFYFAPALIELTRLEELNGEHFGPILHVIKYKSSEIDQLIKDIEKSDYALTLGIHSRDKHWIDFLCTQLNMGNIYINRHITGAQVAAQPFGGHKKSGSGFKAGGPNYLLQFVNEQCISENIAAVGGNVQLVTNAGLD